MQTLICVWFLGGQSIASCLVIKQPFNFCCNTFVTQGVNDSVEYKICQEVMAAVPSLVRGAWLKVQECQLLTLVISSHITCILLLFCSGTNESFAVIFRHYWTLILYVLGESPCFISNPGTPPVPWVLPFNRVLNLTSISTEVNGDWKIEIW